jgi:hypothetical protein
MTKRKIEFWVIPPGQDPEFVACMEEVLGTDAENYDPRHPVWCMDEQLIPLLKETRVPISATKERCPDHAATAGFRSTRRRLAMIFASDWVLRLNG